MSQPDTPEKHVPGSLQAADPKPENTVAGGDGQPATLTDEYQNRQKVNQVAPAQEPGKEVSGVDEPEDETEEEEVDEDVETETETETPQ